MKNVSTQCSWSLKFRRARWLVWMPLAVHCAQPATDDCADTLDCPGQPMPVLDAQCQWRLPDGSIWRGGPRPPASGEGPWRWPNGLIAADQSFECPPAEVADAQAPDAAQEVDAAAFRPGDAGSSSGRLDAGGADAASSQSTVVQLRPDGGPPVDSGVPNAEIVQGECLDGEDRLCGPAVEVGECRFGVQLCSEGAWGDCRQAVYPAARNCSSSLDNNCDGVPDNTEDEVCQCLPGTVEACEVHPGLDGVGPCRAGTRACESVEAVLPQGVVTATQWSACLGAVGPQPVDSCERLGNDATCNGVANEGCQCVVARGNEDCQGDPAASRCDAGGRCVSCVVSEDCSHLDGLPVCVLGQCVQCVPGDPRGCSEAAPVCNALTLQCEAPPEPAPEPAPPVAPPEPEPPVGLPEPELPVTPPEPEPPVGLPEPELPVTPPEPETPVGPPEPELPVAPPEPEPSVDGGLPVASEPS